MARQGKGIFDSFSGNIGEIQGSKYGTLGVIKSKNTKSIKTQTPELTRTKTNFQIANEFYEKLISSNWQIDPNMKVKNQSFRNLFVGTMLKALSIKESGSYQINPIPPTFNFMRFKTLRLIRVWGAVLVNRWGYLPYPLESKEDDHVARIIYNQTTNSTEIIMLFNNVLRFDGIRQRNYNAEIDPGDKAFIFILFINPTRNTISNAILNLYIRPL